MPMCDTCHVCERPIGEGPRECDGDCGERALIFRERQREINLDIDADEIDCDICGLSYGEASHDECRW